MPVVGFQDPETLETLPPDRAAEVFEEKGILPGDVVWSLVREAAETNKDTTISPSICNPDSTCRRQVVIQRFVPYALDPLVLWEAMEGGLFHEAIRRLGVGRPGWHREVGLPTPGDPGPTRTHENGAFQAEVFPGIWMHGTVDLAREDWSEIHDYKTTRFTKSPRDTSRVADATIQLNLYRRLAEVTGRGPVRHLWIWRAQRGSYERSKTFRKLAVPILPDDRLEAAIREHATSLTAWLEQAKTAPDAAALEAFLKLVPLDGREKQMFGNQKCSNYCDVQRECFKRAGLPVF